MRQRLNKISISDFQHFRVKESQTVNLIERDPLNKKYDLPSKKVVIRPAFKKLKLVRD